MKETTKLRSPFAWYGGKAYYANWIIKHFPDHRVFIEPFGGAANILLRKPISPVEVFNDLDSRLVNFFTVIRERELFEKLIIKMELTPYSREIFNELAMQEEPSEPVERAWWFLVRCRQAIGGLGMSKLYKKSWAVSLRTRRSMAEPVSKYLSAIEGLEDIAKRFQTVLIENISAHELIKKHDNEDVLFYCDPPYVPETRHNKKAATYAHEMSLEDHKEMLELLKNAKAKVIISGYDCPLYKEELKDWRKKTLETKSLISNSGENRQEIIWMNFQDKNESETKGLF